MEQSEFYICENNNKIWYLPSKGKNCWHRLDGPAVEYADGSKAWRVNGKLHRLDGPAIEWSDGTKYWYVNGNLNRLDGPAVEHADKSTQWWINGKYMYTDKIKDWLKENKIDLKTLEGQMAFKLRWL